MKTCIDCHQPLSYGIGYSSVCPKCRGKRAAKTNREKAEKHGPTYFDGKHADARRNTL